ncbi:hypothetical protein [Rhizobium sp. No.120]
MVILMRTVAPRLPKRGQLQAFCKEMLMNALCTSGVPNMVDRIKAVVQRTQSLLGLAKRISARVFHIGSRSKPSTCPGEVQSRKTLLTMFFKKSDYLRVFSK